MKKFLNTKVKDMKAITLIALVITIVVLIILAGVLINISLGNNGLFNKAKTAKEMYTNAQTQEELDIAKMTNNIDSYVGYSRTGGSNINYSTTEQEIGTWINNEKLYQKVINKNSTINNDDEIDLGLNNNEFIVSIDGFWICGNTKCPLSYINYNTLY